MTTLILPTAAALELPLALAQQLANLAHQCGRAGALEQYSPDLLSAMQVKSQQAAAALNDRPGQGFHYQQALQ